MKINKKTMLKMLKEDLNVAIKSKLEAIENDDFSDRWYCLGQQEYIQKTIRTLKDLPF